MPTVLINGTTKSFQVNENEILYDALFDRGEELPHGCLSGSCGACRVQVIKGKENLLAPGIIESNTIESVVAEFREKRGEDFIKDKIVRLSCRAKVLGDVEILPLK